MANVSFDVPATFGALLLGGMTSTFLSGAVSTQAYIYGRTYQKDRASVKGLVLTTWLLDVFHTAMVAVSLWYYLIDGFMSQTAHDKIYWSLGLSVASTAALTFIVHCFFVHRLHKLSKGNTFLSLPIALVALLRLGMYFSRHLDAFAEGSRLSGRMCNNRRDASHHHSFSVRAHGLINGFCRIHLQSFSVFLNKFRWVFTLGLVLSSVADVLIASGMCFFLKQSRTGTSDLDRIIDSVMYYTIENGVLTSIATILSLIFWLATPHKLIYMGLHFAISKLYANSLLASLNARKTLRQTHSSMRDVHLPSIGPFSPNLRRFSKISIVREDSDTTTMTQQADVYRVDRDQTGTKMEINVEQTVDCVIDREPEEDGPYPPGYHTGEVPYDTEPKPPQATWRHP
ncbi:hypothetical protein BC835DRAFT_1418114 [Cytidiella melzeri]|nr:hypothetical protein BC835DRAFT_1418114 [Cytidiella melzeri]